MKLLDAVLLVFSLPKFLLGQTALDTGKKKG
jgi:hypothetical protein